MLRPCGPVRGQGRRLLAFHRAAGHEDQFGREGEEPAQREGPGVVAVALQPVVLDRTGDADAMLRDAQLDEPTGVLGILGGHGVDPVECRSQRAAGDDNRRNSAR